MKHQQPGEDADRWVAALAANHRTAAMAEADRAMLEYAVKLTISPREIASADIDGLRRAGFDDRAIHDLCATVAYFAFVNRIADGLGVELEPRWHEGMGS